MSKEGVTVAYPEWQHFYTIRCDGSVEVLRCRYDAPDKATLVEIWGRVEMQTSSEEEKVR